MTVEAATYISELNTTLPAGSDAKSEGDDHIRLIKLSIRNSWPNLTATPVTPTSADLNTITNAATTGATGFNLVTATLGSSDTKAANTAFVQAAITAAALAATLPGQVGNAGKYIQTDGTNASWQELGLTVATVAGTTQTASAGSHYVLTNVAATTVTLPAGVSGATVAVTCTGSLLTNVITPAGAETIMETAGSMTLDKAGVTVTLRYLNSSWRII